MGISIEQYRAAIGLHHHSNNTSSSSSSSSSARSRIPNDYSPSSAQHEHIQKTYNVRGSWKLHACALLIIFLSLTSTCIPPTCQKLLLIQGGVETNPGPTLAEDRKLKREYVLASLCENAPEMEPGTKNFKKTAIRDCIRLYNNIAMDADQTKTNKAKFTGVDREILLATVTYLGGRDMTDFTKPAVIVELIQRIDHHLPHACIPCKTNYVIEQRVQSLLNCSKCGRGVHADCFLELIEHPAATDNTITPSPEEILKMINPYNIPGWVYLCACCNKKFIPSPDEGMYQRRKIAGTEKQNPSEPVISTADITTESNNSDDAAVKEVTFSIHEDVHVIEDVDKDDDQDYDDDQPPVLTHHNTGLPIRPSSLQPNPGTTANANGNQKLPPSNTGQHHRESQSYTDKEMPICRFYINNNCKHGMSGKGIPGTKCKFSHPRRCSKLITFGTGSKGCNKGRQCKFFHPRMCNNSLNTRYCPNLDCQYVHTKGTKRTDRSHEEKSQHIPQSEYADQNEHTKYNRERQVVTNTNDRDHFLGMLRDLKQELFQMMEQRLALHPPKQPFPQPPLHPVYPPRQMQMLNPYPIASHTMTMQ